jgi:preprotein translocase subunit Sec61beta
MPKKGEKASGLMSSAGLMRYFETEETAIKISPKAVVIACIIAAIAAILLNAYFGMWPKPPAP